MTFTTTKQDPDTLAKVRQTELVREFSRLTGPLAKETWLAETCLQERRLGRKTLVYLRPGLGIWLLSLRTGIETHLPETTQAPILIPLP